MNNSNQHQAIQSIVKARGGLESALADLEKLPAFHPNTVPFAAHALSNFLTVTEATVDLLRTSDSPSRPDMTQWLDGLRHATHLMTHAVGQLMNNAVGGELKLRFERLDLRHLAAGACASYERLALRKRVRILLEEAADVPLVWTDRVAVATILGNLLSNALKHSPEGESVRVNVKRHTGAVICSVQDRGPGISPEQKRFFQRGAQLSAVPTGKEAGSGYGLAVAKALVEQLGGTIWVDSAQGKGSRFSFRLPTIREVSELCA
ncbi:MAG TPA: HAMP domain-containing sensor histidine kinase [Terriglobia bacterium]|nr:HAMP domain-containing sensor histidine kinase [Terriglobia bacterium]